MSKKIYFLLFLIVSSGCTQDNLFETKKYVNTVKNRSAEKIEALPEVKQYTNVAYSSEALNSPFVPRDPKNKAESIGNLSIKPNLSRALEPLESFPLDSLHMVGTLEIRNELYAVIRDPGGVIYQVHPGNYMGTNYGKIIKISVERIEINEFMLDSSNRWQKRLSIMILGE